MSKILCVMLLLAFVAFGQQERIAIINTIDTHDSINFSDLSYLTDKLRNIAGDILPKNRYGIMTQQSIVDRLGSQERAAKECGEATCLADLGRKISADYIVQGYVGRFSGKLTIKVELYSVRSGNLLGSLADDSGNLEGLLAVLNEKAPDMFKKMPGVSDGRIASSPSVTGGISGLQSGADDEFYVERRYLANFATEPPGAILSFNGMPAANCAKTPCSTELAEGSIRIIAALDQYETADTTVSIKQNNQNINIRLKANFGVLEIKPAYSEGVGKNENWNLTINGKAFSFLENRMSPNKYSVKLSHRCYEDIRFDAGINKDSREVFDMAGHAKLKKGGLVLSAEKDDKPVREPVFVNGQRVGETPFSGSVPLCSEIAIGEEKLAVKLENKQTVRYVHKIRSGGVSGGVLTDSRDGKKYKVVKISKQTWMAENLNYDANGSKCYDNKPENCTKYGRLYDWNTAKKACPSGWHLPSKGEWEVLDNAVGGEKAAGKNLKAKSGWNRNGFFNGNGTDEFNFSALPGGHGNSDGSFRNIGIGGYWWSASEIGVNYAYYRSIFNSLDAAYLDYNNSYVSKDGNIKSSLFSIRCLLD
ncbi:MAG: PEGA domain-containing protein [Candidatus Fibromonas sp.]|jgi:uncharacterized protein (TIGR02145 family)|nr:PEGA domain-containing protein [Candidatus Fibromonas sp.]